MPSSTEIKAKAVITTKWGGRGVRPVTVQRVLDYFIDSAVDTDSDSWNLTLGDPENGLVAMLKRDNEVRVNIYGVGTTVESLHTGFADEIVMNDEGQITMSGRDITAPAVDATAPPGSFTNIRPQALVAREARELRIGDRLKLDSAAPFKLFERDGSESYWESWYRFYRKRGMWLWADADGSIYGAKLNYFSKPLYKFGRSPGRIGHANSENWIPVETVEIRKNSQARVGEVWVIGHRGDIGFVAKAVDPTTSTWIKKPRRIIQGVHARNQAEALVEAWEEIHESKVGSIEVRLTVFSPGYVIRQNQMCEVNIPEMGLRGTFYIVGQRIVGGGTQGVAQEIRLREKLFAVSRRRAPDPKIPDPPSESTVRDTPGELTGVRWARHFVDAAYEFHRPWNFEFFLALLLSMCQVETGFRNVRRGGTTEWYDPNDVEREGRTAGQRNHSELFANHKENPLGGYEEYAVGPMQLHYRPFKEQADAYGGKNDEYIGGRWNPKANIRAAAKAFRGMLEGLDPKDESTAYNAVGYYNGGVKWQSKAESRKYVSSVKKFLTDEFLEKAVDARGTAKDNSTSTGSESEKGKVYPLSIRHEGFPGYPTGNVAGHYAVRQNDQWQTWRAVDLGIAHGTPVYAMFSGVISPPNTNYSGYGGNSSSDPRMAGLRLHLVTDGGNAYYYAHLSRLIVKKGAKVKAGQVIGYSGTANGKAHLHLAGEQGDIEKLIIELGKDFMVKGPQKGG